MKILILTLVFGTIPYAVTGSACDVVPMTQWGFSPSRLVEKLPTPVGLVVVTHTVTADCTTDNACETVARAMRNAHLQVGYRDIGLSFLVGGNGKIYEGAGWRIGTHTLGHSSRSISLSFIGDFRDVIPTEAALKAAQQFLDCSKTNQSLSSDYILLGQRQLSSTISPGDALQAIIQKWPHFSLNLATRHTLRNSTPG